jgi:hypothetical protein
MYLCTMLHPSYCSCPGVYIFYLASTMNSCASGLRNCYWPHYFGLYKPSCSMQFTFIPYTNLRLWQFIRYVFHILLTIYFSAGNCVVVICYPDKLIDAYDNSNREKVSCNSLQKISPVFSLFSLNSKHLSFVTSKFPHPYKKNVPLQPFNAPFPCIYTHTPQRRAGGQLVIHVLLYLLQLSSWAHVGVGGLHYYRNLNYDGHFGLTVAGKDVRCGGKVTVVT